MAHVHGAAAKSATAHAGHGAGASMAHHAHAGHATAMAAHQGAAKAGMLAMGTATAAATHPSKGVVGRLSRHPLVVFSLGLALGYLIHKYRKEIIQSAAGLTGKGDPQAQENLEDLVAECSECDEGNASAGAK